MLIKLIGDWDNFSNKKYHNFNWKLRVKLIKHGLSEEVVTQCENIMLAELSDVKDKLQVMQNQHVALLEQMQLLEVLCASTCF